MLYDTGNKIIVTLIHIVYCKKICLPFSYSYLFIILSLPTPPGMEGVMIDFNINNLLEYYHKNFINGKFK